MLASVNRPFHAVCAQTASGGPSGCYSLGVPSLTPRERWQIGLGVLTAFVGPEARRAADITSVVGAHDPREVLFGVLAVARDLLGIIEAQSGKSSSEILQTLAKQEGEEYL